MKPDQFRERVERLDILLAAEGRAPESLRRTMMHRAVIGRTEQEAPAKLEGADIGALPGARGVDRRSVAGDRRSEMRRRSGVRSGRSARLDMDDMDGLELISAQVMPQLA
ncbi:MAG: hypothetical protein R2843_13230 [Thermomicrobiales bacterium]